MGIEEHRVQIMQKKRKTNNKTADVHPAASNHIKHERAKLSSLEAGIVKPNKKKKKQDPSPCCRGPLNAESQWGEGLTMPTVASES